MREGGGIGRRSWEGLARVGEIARRVSGSGWICTGCWWAGSAEIGRLQGVAELERGRGDPGQRRSAMVGQFSAGRPAQGFQSAAGPAGKAGYKIGCSQLPLFTFFSREYECFIHIAERK
ncbi:hypothetical protein RJT34_02852 [Clitoria ternatea]|uniref:Uncharacterized protein n=1 Tax=Clitoria ternatea TaxID=43366 RepID=A0AAN9Q1Z4_CLITE